MEKLILVEKINEEGKLISKEVPENLLSLYLTDGWKIVGKQVKQISEVKDTKIK